MPQHPAPTSTAVSGTPAGRSMDAIRADFHRLSAARVTAVETLNLSMEAMYTRKIDSLLDEANAEARRYANG